MNQTQRPVPALPATQHAIQVVGPGQLVHNRAKPVQLPGPTQLVVKVEAVGICFSDTKLLKAFSTHLRKAEISGGIDRATLAEIPSYVPGELPLVPGHEVAGRIVAIGAGVTRHSVGERVLVQTDYRHLPTPGANAAFGYNFEGGLQEYVLLDERVIIEPETGERFLIPVDETPSGSAVALLEPWACVEASYASRERGALAPGGHLLVVADAGHAVDGLAPLLAARAPADVTAAVADDGQRAAIQGAVGPALPATAFVARCVRAGRPVLRRHRLLRRRRRVASSSSRGCSRRGACSTSCWAGPGSGGRWRSTSAGSTTTSRAGSARWARRPSMATRSPRRTASSGPATGSR